MINPQDCDVVFIVPAPAEGRASAECEKLETAFEHFCSLVSTEKGPLSFEVTTKNNRVFIGLTSHDLDALILTGTEEMQLDKGELLFTSNGVNYTLADHEA